MPDSVLYEEVLCLDGERIYSNTQSLLQYIHILTILIQQYLLAQKTLRTFFQPVLYSDSILTETCERCGQEKQENGKNSSGFLNARTKSIGSSQMETENCEMEIDNEGAVKCECEHVNGMPMSEKCQHNSMSPGSIWRLDCNSLDQSKDLEVLRKFKNCLKQFKTHLWRLCVPDDVGEVMSMLQDLELMSDYISSL